MNFFLVDAIESPGSGSAIYQSDSGVNYHKIAKPHDNSVEMSCIFFIDVRAVQFLNTTYVTSAQ